MTTLLRQMLFAALVLLVSGAPALAQSSGQDLMIRAYEGYGAFKSGEHERAFEILKPVAEAGHSGAMSQLAYLYEHGLGTDKDEELAAYWSAKAQAR